MTQPEDTLRYYESLQLTRPLLTRKWRISLYLWVHRREELHAGWRASCVGISGTLSAGVCSAKTLATWTSVACQGSFLFLGHIYCPHRTRSSTSAKVLASTATREKSSSVEGCLDKWLVKLCRYHRSYVTIACIHNISRSLKITWRSCQISGMPTHWRSLALDQLI